MSIASRRSRAPARASASTFTLIITAASGAFMIVAGVWAFFAPASFADAVGFAGGGHFVHDAGAFQIGIGATLLLAIAWTDALSVALAGYILGAAVHVVAHLIDLEAGRLGAAEPVALGASVIVALIALGARLKEVGR